MDRQLPTQVSTVRAHFRRRPNNTALEDLEWLRNARDQLRQTVSKVLPPAEAWPFRAAAHSRVLKALGALQHELHLAIAECGRDAGVPADFKENEWLGFPPPRR